MDTRDVKIGIKIMVCCLGMIGCLSMMLFFIEPRSFLLVTQTLGVWPSYMACILCWFVPYALLHTPSQPDRGSLKTDSAFAQPTGYSRERLMHLLDQQGSEEEGITSQLSDEDIRVW